DAAAAAILHLLHEDPLCKLGSGCGLALSLRRDATLLEDPLLKLGSGCGQAAPRPPGGEEESPAFRPGRMSSLPASHPIALRGGRVLGCLGSFTHGGATHACRDTPCRT